MNCDGPSRAHAVRDADRLENELLDKKPLYTEAEARAEADRCLYCVDAPCIKACPTQIDIPTFIKKIASGNLRGSATTILEQNLLGYSCARVCPVEVLCVGDCVYTAWGREPIPIGRLQRYATETAMSGSASFSALLPRRRGAAASAMRVACVGAGPASLAFAGTMAREGHEAVIFEKGAIAGGLNATGIAPYKLHAEDAQREVEFVASLGVEVVTGIALDASDAPGRISAKKLLDTYDAVFLGLGLGVDTTLGIPGESGAGVVGATAWIERMKLSMNREQRFEIEGKTIVVVGGGNTAIDVARECAQLGAARVVMVYRRGASSMSGYAHEMDAARVDGVEFVAHARPVAVVRNVSGAVTALRVSGPRVSGTPSDVSDYDLPCDLVAVAIGQSKLREVATYFPGVELDDRGCIACDPTTGQTGHAKVFAGGDCVNGGKEVVNAVANGRDAARTLLERWSLKFARVSPSSGGQAAGA